MDKILYLECYSGISGDMTISALLDLGGDRDLLEKSLASLNLDGYSLEFGRRNKCGIDAYKFDVVLENQVGVHHNHHHHHEDSHDHNHHSHEDHHHQHRGLKEISKLINESGISQGAKELALKIFDYIADAEAKAHNIPREEVHFHEVGAIDSIVDVVGAAVLIDDLGIKDIVVSEIYEGSGHVKCAHGILPVPVPAVANIFMEAGLNFRITDSKGEMVTPTGAAIAASIKSLEEIPEGYIIEKIGIGSGKKDFPHANILRAFLLKKKLDSDEDIYLLESNIDDSTGENLGYIVDKLFDQGALDLFMTPIFMKKNRPAYKLSVLAKKKDLEDIEYLIFKETSSIGIRKHQVERTIMEREIITATTKFGDIRLKRSSFKDIIKYTPEYEDVKALADKHNISFRQVYNEAQKAVRS